MLFPVHHDGSEQYIQVDGEITIGRQVKLFLRTGKNASIQRVFLRTSPDGEEQIQDMFLSDKSDINHWWELAIPITMPVTRYRFLLYGEDGLWWYNQSGLHRAQPTDAEDFCLLADYQSPDWVRECVFYQIFPDRFANGNPENDVRDGEYVYRGRKSVHRNWGEEPSHTGSTVNMEFFGGDLEGITEKLDVLTDLGVNALYLTPIFSSYSNHRYDVNDFEKIDPHLGGEKALVELRNASRERNIRLMLDIVPNHCGVMHPWFQEAVHNPEAESAEFFTFEKHPDEYVSWLGVKSLPKLNFTSQKLRKIFYSGSESIFRRWLREPYGLDAWRIDVANMLGRQGTIQINIEVGQGIRQAVKDENPQAYLLGENFFDGTPQLQGDFLDATMNYSGFGKPLAAWLGQQWVFAAGANEPLLVHDHYPTGALVDAWQNFRAAIPWQIARQQFNLLDSHDTPRLRQMLGMDEDKLRLAVIAQMTYPGVPCVYYGDEIGMGKTPHSTRACMIWDEAEWDQDLRMFYQKLIRLRRTSLALREGGYQVLAVGKNTLVYLRTHGQEQIVTILQRGGEDINPFEIDVAAGGIADGTIFEDYFSGKQENVADGKLILSLPGKCGSIWRCLNE